MCSHMKGTRVRNPFLKLQKSDYPVWQTGEPGFVRTNDSQECHRASTGCFSSGQAASEWWRGVNHDNFGG
jgi:hypothetical protein